MESDCCSVSAGYPSRYQCLKGDWDILAPLLAGDILTFLPYVAIPLALVVFVRAYIKRNPRHVFPAKFFWLFSWFILSCGIDHGLDALIVRYGALYPVRAWWGVCMTAPSSCLTAFVLCSAVWQYVRKPKTRKWSRP